MMQLGTIDNVWGIFLVKQTFLIGAGIVILAG
jgi:hypothetical protein